MAATMMGKHFVLIHGVCHGAWCWFKLKPLLESQGHRVTTLDLAASGISPVKLEELQSFEDYTAPLLQFMASIPAAERVILVGHSFGGFNLALAADKYPDKVSVAVFLAAFMPDTSHNMSYVLDQHYERNPKEARLDIKYSAYGSPEQRRVTITFGPEYLGSKLYQLCSKKDLELAKLLIRPGALYLEDLKAKKLRVEGYGSIRKVYITCNEDIGMAVEFQRWMIQNAGVVEVNEIKNADHMAMLSKAQELCQCLLEIEDHYA